MSVHAIDVFAGPGGWDEGLLGLGITPLGIELDDAACATRAAAGHLTLQADVADLDPRDFAPIDGCDLLIGSPPCPTFSNVGKRSGMDEMELISQCARNLTVGIDVRHVMRGKLSDPRSLLVVEPLRWAIALRPRWIALEQVPPVLGLWKFYARILEERFGYRAWAGTLSAEQFGVPQTRERAFLIASLTETPHPPTPTHQRYEPGVPAQEQHTLEGILLPWVSMAEALGWGMTGRPYPTIACSSGTGGPDMEKVGGSGARAQLYAEQTSGRWLVNTGRDWKPGGGREDAQTFDASAQPAPTVDGKGRWHVRTGNFTAKARDLDGGRTKAGSAPYERPLEAPAPTLDGKVGAAWTLHRPATTVAGDPRIAQPGHKKDVANPDSPGRMEGAIRVSLADAAVLQGFPHDYPFQGTKSKQFEQVGNAVPPPLARAVIAALVTAEVCAA